MDLQCSPIIILHRQSSAHWSSDEDHECEEEKDDYIDRNGRSRSNSRRDVIYSNLNNDSLLNVVERKNENGFYLLNGKQFQYEIIKKDNHSSFNLNSTNYYHNNNHNGNRSRSTRARSKRLAYFAKIVDRRRDESSSDDSDCECNASNHVHDVVVVSKRAKHSSGHNHNHNHTHRHSHGNSEDKHVIIEQVRDIFNKKSFAKCLYRELLIMRLFSNHKNIINLMDIISPKIHSCFNDLLLVYKFVSETNLSAIFKTKQYLSCVQVKYILYQICSVIRDMHQLNITHGNLQPSNIFIDKQCTIQLANFENSCLNDFESNGSMSPIMMKHQLNYHHKKNISVRRKSSMRHLSPLVMDNDSNSNSNNNNNNNNRKMSGHKKRKASDGSSRGAPSKYTLSTSTRNHNNHNNYQRMKQQRNKQYDSEEDEQKQIEKMHRLRNELLLHGFMADHESRHRHRHLRNGNNHHHNHSNNNSNNNTRNTRNTRKLHHNGDNDLYLNMNENKSRNELQLGAIAVGIDTNDTPRSLPLSSINIMDTPQKTKQKKKLPFVITRIDTSMAPMSTHKSSQSSKRSRRRNSTHNKKKKKGKKRSRASMTMLAAQLVYYLPADLIRLCFVFYHIPTYTIYNRSQHKPGRGRGGGRNRSTARYKMKRKLKRSHRIRYACQPMYRSPEQIFDAFVKQFRSAAYSVVTPPISIGFTNNRNHNHNNNHNHNHNNSHKFNANNNNKHSPSITMSISLSPSIREIQARKSSHSSSGGRGTASRAMNRARNGSLDSAGTPATTSSASVDSPSSMSSSTASLSFSLSLSCTPTKQTKRARFNSSVLNNGKQTQKAKEQRRIGHKASDVTSAFNLGVSETNFTDLDTPSPIMQQHNQSSNIESHHNNNNNNTKSKARQKSSGSKFLAFATQVMAKTGQQYHEIYLNGQPNLSTATSTPPVLYQPSSPKQCMFQTKNQKFVASDVWSIGCITSELLQMQRKIRADPRKRKFLFSMQCLSNPGSVMNNRISNIEQMRVVFDVIGTPSKREIAHIRNKRIHQYLRQLPTQKPTNMRRLFNGASEEAIQLLTKCLKFNIHERIDIAQILDHPYFDQIRYHVKNNGESIYENTIWRTQLQNEIPNLDSLKIDQIRQCILQEISSLQTHS